MQTEMGQEMMQQAGLKIDQDNPKETLKHAKGLINSLVISRVPECNTGRHAGREGTRGSKARLFISKTKVQIDQQIEKKNIC